MRKTHTLERTQRKFASKAWNRRKMWGMDYWTSNFYSTEDDDKYLVFLEIVIKNRFSNFNGWKITKTKKKSRKIAKKPDKLAGYTNYLITNSVLLVSQVFELSLSKTLQICMVSSLKRPKPRLCHSLILFARLKHSRIWFIDLPIQYFVHFC